MLAPRQHRPPIESACHFTRPPARYGDVMSCRKSCIASQLPLRLFVGAYLLGIPAALADDAAGGCVQNRALDTAHYVDALKGDARNIGAAIFQQVASDLTVAPESAAYLVQSDTVKRALPMEEAPSLGGI